MRIYYRCEQRDRFLVIFKAVPDRSHSIHFIDRSSGPTLLVKKYVCVLVRLVLLPSPFTLLAIWKWQKFEV